MFGRSTHNNNRTVVTKVKMNPGMVHKKPLGTSQESIISGSFSTVDYQNYSAHVIDRSSTHVRHKPKKYSPPTALDDSKLSSLKSAEKENQLWEEEEDIKQGKVIGETLVSILLLNQQLEDNQLLKESDIENLEKILSKLHDSGEVLSAKKAIVDTHLTLNHIKGMRLNEGLEKITNSYFYKKTLDKYLVGHLKPKLLTKLNDLLQQQNF